MLLHLLNVVYYLVKFPYSLLGRLVRHVNRVDRAVGNLIGVQPFYNDFLTIAIDNLLDYIVGRWKGLSVHLLENRGYNVYIVTPWRAVIFHIY